MANSTGSFYIPDSFLAFDFSAPQNCIATGMKAIARRRVGVQRANVKMAIYSVHIDGTYSLMGSTGVVNIPSSTATEISASFPSPISLPAGPYVLGLIGQDDFGFSEGGTRTNTLRFTTNPPFQYSDSFPASLTFVNSSSPRFSGAFWVVGGYPPTLTILSWSLVSVTDTTATIRVESSCVIPSPGTYYFNLYTTNLAQSNLSAGQDSGSTNTVDIVFDGLSPGNTYTIAADVASVDGFFEAGGEPANFDAYVVPSNPLNFTLSCIHGSSCLQLANGSELAIAWAKPGDVILAGDGSEVVIKDVVPCWLKTPANPTTHGVVVFETDSLEMGVPSKRFAIDTGHPMCVPREFQRLGMAALKPARTFANSKSIRVTRWAEVANLLPGNNLRYDLVLTEGAPGAFLANNVCVQARSDAKTPGYDHR